MGKFLKYLLDKVIVSEEGSTTSEDANRGSSGLRRILLWSAAGVFSLALIAVLAVLYVTFVGVTIDGGFLRARVANAFSESIGREVRFDGPLEMHISSRPRLRIGGLHIANAPGFGGGDFATLGEARLALDLWHLLFDKQLRIDELSGSNVHAQLQVKPDGSNNWSLFTRHTTSDPGDSRRGRASEMIERPLARIDIQQISLTTLEVDFSSARNKDYHFYLDSLSARSPVDAPVEMTLNGKVDRSFPYEMDFKGGRLADLASDTPWPVTLTLNFLSSTLSIDGSVSGRGHGEVNFGLGTEDLSEVERMFQTNFPDVGAAGIGAKVKFSPLQISMSELTGVLGRTTFTGNLDFDARNEKPNLTGSLIATTLDMRPFLGEPTDQSEQAATIEAEVEPGDTYEARSFADLYTGIESATFDLRQLNSMNADVTLGVDQWLSLPGDAKKARLQIRAEDGQLHVPLTATIAGVSLAGQVNVDATQIPPKFDLNLGTEDSDLGDLAELFLGARGVRGRLGRFEFSLGATGASGKELVKSLDVDLDIERGRFSYGNIEGGRPVNFALDELAVRLPRGQPLTGKMRGDLLGNRFSASLAGGALEPIMQQAQTPVDLRVSSGDVQARVHGLIEQPAPGRGPKVKFEFSSPRAGELAAWLGLTPGAQEPVEISGDGHLYSSSWQVRNLLLKLGRSALRIDASQGTNNDAKLLNVSLAAEEIDIEQLESMLPRSDKPKQADSAPALNIPLLPKQIDLADADISVRVGNFAGMPVDVSDLSFDGRIRNAYMNPSPFSANVADAEFNGAVLLDLRGTEPTASLWLYASDLDVGKVLQTLGVVRDLDANFEEFAINLTARSSRIGDMLARSELLGTVGGGHIVLRDANTDGEAHITLSEATLRADPGQPIRLNMDGALDDVPIAISIDTASAADLVNPDLPLRFALTTNTSNTRVRLDGEIARPVGSDIELALDAGGARFSDLDQVTRASLPPWGPWSAAGKFRMSPRGYEVTDLRLQVGESLLKGFGRYETHTGRPQISIALNSPVIQLDDFRFGDWSPVEEKPEEETEVLSIEEARQKAADASNQAQKLLSPEMLSRQDANLLVEVEQVLSGQDKLGQGRLQASLLDGRADIGPIEVKVPGGEAAMRLGYEPSQNDVAVDFHLDIDNFDYGILARRIQPDADVSGKFSVKMDVDSRARYLSEILRHGSGRIDFGVWPQDMKAGIFDLWAVNVFVALAPEVDPDKASRVNCAIARFRLEDGKLTERFILMDTSRMRVSGTGNADFSEENFDLRMSPRAKTPQMFSLATPIEVSGPFDDFSIRASPGEVIGTAARFLTSIIWVPLQRLSGNKIPSDGSDVCNVSLDTIPES